MIAGIVAFVAVATSVAYGSPCGIHSNEFSGNVVNTGLNGGLFAQGILGSGLVRSSQIGSNVVATPTFVSPIFVPTACSASAPASQSFHGVADREVFSTEAQIPEYSTLVAPTAPSSGASVVFPSFSTSQVASSEVATSDVCESASSPVIATSYGYPSVQSEVYETPAISVAASPESSPLVESAQILSSGYGSPVFGSSGISSGVVSGPVSATLVSAPVAEQVNVAAPVISGEFVSSGVSSESFFNGYNDEVRGY